VGAEITSEPAEAAQNGAAKTGSTRRRRSSRGRGKAAQDGGSESTTDGDGTGATSESAELVSTGN
jgi:ribonuclease E